MTADKNETRPQLRKAIGGLGFFCLAFGSMIGVGSVVSLGLTCILLRAVT